MGALITSAPIDIKSEIEGNEPENLFLSEDSRMKTNDVAHLLVELSYFDIRFKDAEMTVINDDVFRSAVVKIKIPGESVPRDVDYIGQLKFFLRRRVDLARWYISDKDPHSPGLIINL